MIKLAYGRMLQRRARRRARASARAARRRWPRGSPPCRRRSAARRAAGEYGFYELVDQAEHRPRDHGLRRGRRAGATTTSWCSASAARRSAPRRCSTRSAAGLERVDDEGAGVLPPAHRAGERRSRRRSPRRSGGSIRAACWSTSSASRAARRRRWRSTWSSARGSRTRSAAAAHRHLVFTTDPARGALREIAAREGIATLDVPPDVGGRFSVLSPVGLLPAALVGIDIAALLAGAGRRSSAPRPTTCSQNPAALYAALHWAADADLGARIHVLMPYTDRLREFAEWYRQLWAESLGKRVDRDGRRGPHRSHAGGGRGRHRPAQPGAALHGRPVRQGDHLRRGRRPRRRRADPAAAEPARPARRPRLPAGPHARRAAAAPSTRPRRRRSRRWGA